eukprot:SAG31_NODE_19594_length_597_cov_1.248996_1_plen_76_part_01
MLIVIGLTAWVGTNICEPGPGKIFVVSGAAVAVGSVAGQLAKLRGARVVGIVGDVELEDQVLRLSRYLGYAKVPLN